MAAPKGPKHLLATTVMLALLGVSCSPPEAGRKPSLAELPGTWQAVLDSPGGELPFMVVITEGKSGSNALDGFVINGSERAPFSSVSVEEERVSLAFDFYDSTITAQLERDSSAMTGRWQKVVPEGLTTLPFRARKLESAALPPRFEQAREGAPPMTFEGEWAALFTDESGSYPARGEFLQNGNRISGTFLTTTGDYRFLEGNVVGNKLLLSTFDGGHAFLFHADMTATGTLEGDFWSRDTYHAKWTADRARETETVLPDAWSLAGLTNREGRFDFDFPDLEGRRLSLDHPRFAGKVVLVDIFGSWCPNCNDKAPLLAQWDRRFRDRGLEIVGLAYEFTGERERDARQVRRYAARHGIEFTLLLAGVSDKTRASASLRDLTSVVAYPTSVFIGRDGKVRRVHSGFAGPGTGRHHQELVAEFEALLEEMLADEVAVDGG